MRRDLVFVIDTSGSMHGTSIAQARRALLLALNGLRPVDRFNVVQFNSTTSALFDDSVEATPGNLALATRYVAALASRDDIDSQLLRAGDGEDALSDTELRSQLVTLLLAGHETTATALAWSMYELGRSEDHLRRAQRAADEGDDAYLEAVVKESMRLHPVIPMVVRHLMEPATIGGRELPAGTNIGPSILVSHAREDNFEGPEELLGQVVNVRITQLKANSLFGEIQ